MNCPECNRKGLVRESRPAVDCKRRRHECSQGHRWTTFETYERRSEKRNPNGRKINEEYAAFRARSET